MSATDWPRGCLGYAFNLVRPVQRGHRASLLYNLLSSTLVFESLADAEAYREFLATVGGLWQCLPCWETARPAQQLLPSSPLSTLVLLPPPPCHHPLPTTPPPAETAHRRGHHPDTGWPAHHLPGL